MKKEKWLSVVFYEPARKEILRWPTEIRLKGADGIYRAFYILKTELGILVFHGFKKKTQKTPVKEIDTGKTRLSALLKELGNEE